jgi:hypothetical protein
MLYIFENSIPPVLDEKVDNEVRTKYQSHIYNDEKVAYVMLAGMTLELQRHHENMDVCIIIIHLKKLFYVANALRGMRPLNNCFGVK